MNKNDIATHRNDSRITKKIGDLQMTATLAQISDEQRAWLDKNGYTLHADEYGNVSARRPGASVGDPNAVWSLTEDRQLWEVSTENGSFVSSFTGRFHVSLISNINGRESVYDRAAHVTLRAALQMTR